MKTNILANHKFVLGLQEDWNSYYEATVEFVREVTFQSFDYLLFEDRTSNRSYYLRPRLVGHDIEGIFVEKNINVNISKKDPDPHQNGNKPPIFYATGMLRLLKD